jgi:cardiolipin synthase (CMP-forming)
MPLLSQMRAAPNQLTLLRLIIVPFIIINIVDERFGWALGLFILAGISDALDGLLARLLKQKTLLGQYLDPIADKLLLSTLFPVLSATHKLPWMVTILVMSRDVSLLIVAAIFTLTTSYREFKPNIFGKINTVAQIATILVVLMDETWNFRWLGVARQLGIWTTMAFTVLSGVSYVLRATRKLHAGSVSGPDVPDSAAVPRRDSA